MGKRKKKKYTTVQKAKVKNRDYHDLRMTILFVLEALVSIALYQVLGNHFGFGFGDMPKDYQNTFAPAFIAISFLSGLLVCLFYNSDYYQENGDIDFEIMSTEEFYISSLLVLSILALPWLIVFANTKYAIIAFAIGLCTALFTDRHYGYSFPFSINGIRSNYKPSQKIKARTKGGGTVTLTMRSLVIMLISFALLLITIFINNINNIW